MPACWTCSSGKDNSNTSCRVTPRWSKTEAEISIDKWAEIRRGWYGTEAKWGEQEHNKTQCRQGAVMEYHRSAPISYFNLPLFLYYFPPSSEFQCFAYISRLTCPKAVILWYLCCPLQCCDGSQLQVQQAKEILKLTTSLRWNTVNESWS